MLVLRSLSFQKLFALSVCLCLFPMDLSQAFPVANPASRKIGPQDSSGSASSPGAAEVLQLVGSDTSCLNGDTGKGKMTQGFYEGVLVSYARSVCRPNNDPVKQAMISGNGDNKDGPGTTGDPMDDTYMMLFSLGMWESGGCVDIGRDTTNASSGTDQTAEAGCFQTSENIHQAGRPVSAAMRNLEQFYQSNSSLCDKDLFLRGAAPKADAYSSGSQWRELMKSCPALNVEHAAISVLHVPQHYGPVKNGKARKMTECRGVLQAVKTGVASNSSLCSQLLPGLQSGNIAGDSSPRLVHPASTTAVPFAVPVRRRAAGRF